MMSAEGKLEEIKRLTKTFPDHEGNPRYTPNTDFFGVPSLTWLIRELEQAREKIKELENWKLKYIKQVLDKIENHDGIFLVEFSPTVLDDWRKLLKETK